MISFTFPSTRENGTPITLLDLLNCIPDNEWVWSAIDFYGMGTAPQHLSMAVFEQYTTEAPTGYTFSWPALKAFAQALEQMMDGKIVGVSQKADLLKFTTDYQQDACEIVIEAFDSTEWSVSLQDQKLAQQMTRVFCPPHRKAA